MKNNYQRLFSIVLCLVIILCTCAFVAHGVTFRQTPPTDQRAQSTQSGNDVTNAPTDSNLPATTNGEVSNADENNKTEENPGTATNDDNSGADTSEENSDTNVNGEDSDENASEQNPNDEELNENPPMDAGENTTETIGTDNLSADTDSQKMSVALSPVDERSVGIAVLKNDGRQWELSSEYYCSTLGLILFVVLFVLLNAALIFLGIKIALWILNSKSNSGNRSR